MQVIEFFECKNRDYWLDKIEQCDWDAGKYLAYLMRTDGLCKLVGEGSRVLMLTDGDELVSFSTLAPLDDVQPTELSPWMGWIYTFPKYRGQRCAGRLFAHAEMLAAKDGASAIHISTNHIGLYEKYGFEFYRMDKDVEGEDTRVYIKRLGDN